MCSCNILNPGPVDTPMLSSSAKAFPNPDTILDEVAAKTSMKRLGLPVDIANAAVFFVSPRASWITGATLTIDGGISC